MFDIKKLLKSGPLYLDGATGTNLQKAGLPSGVCPEMWIMEHKEVLAALQRGYAEAGSDIVYAPTFSGNRIKLEEYGLGSRIEEINRTLVRLTKEAVGDRCYVAGNLTMTGEAIEPVGTLAFEALVDCYKEQVRIIADEGVDLFVIETMMNLGEARAALLAVKETTELPVFVTITVDENGRTLYGTDPAAALVALEALGADAFGINCSAGPDKLVDIVERLDKYAGLPIIVKPNAGLPKFEDGQTVYDMPSGVFVREMKRLVAAGASILGGCCGTDASYIRQLKQETADMETVFGRADRLRHNGRRLLAGERKVLEIEMGKQFMIVGERINPTGKKALQAAFKAGDYEPAVVMAEAQCEKGAHILDINVGMGGIDEKEAMLHVIDDVSVAVDVPLCIDSSSVDVVEAALRRYHGRALVNSVSCEAVKIEKLLPIVKKYGAMFILLPLSDGGLPKTIDERKENIELVLEKARALRMDKQDIVVDGLVATVGADATAAQKTLETIAYCTSQGLATICGLSNISFGLPDRMYINSIFLALAISRGLTMAIANPSQELLMRSGFTADLLMGKPDAALNYIEKSAAFNEEKAAVQQEKAQSAATDTAPDTAQNQNVQAKPISGESSIPKAESDRGRSTPAAGAGAVPENGALALIRDDVLGGYKKKVESHIRAALAQGCRASDILNGCLIPAINLVGDYFSSQKYFLPQLMMSADTMRAGIDLLEPLLLEENAGKTEGPLVVLATVRGDIHDIGKNLVAMMMKNYGFRVIDLGKDVEAGKIIETARTKNADIIGLSALMTTTMQEMKHVIALAKEAGLRAKIILGGAAVTADFAAQIGADGYSEDAVGAVELVKRLVEDAAAGR